MREVDEAVRTDEALSAFRRFGIPVGILVFLGLAGFAAYLYMERSQESELEAQSVALVQAIDEFEEQNDDIADGKLVPLTQEGSPGIMASARMMRAGIALQDGRLDDAIALYDEISADETAPQPSRDAATLYSVTVQYDDLDPQEVIDRLGPLANPDNAFFGSAGELVAHAYLAQDRKEQAGPLLVQIAQAEDIPPSIQMRAAQLASAEGFDVIEEEDDAADEASSDAVAGEEEAAQ